MDKRWISNASDAKSKQEERFARWSESGAIPFVSDDAALKYKERTALLRDAIQMIRCPDRIPICPSVGHFPFEYAGITWKEALYNKEKLKFAWRKFHTDFPLDATTGPANIPWGPALDMLEMKNYRWPGGNLADNMEYQYVDKEYMLEEEYYDLIDDPTGFFLTVYFPRIFGSLEGFGKIGVLPAVNEVAKIPAVFSVFAQSDVRTALEKLGRAGDILSEWFSLFREIGTELKAGGIPSFTGGFTKAPFDVIGDCLRGTRGVIMDMFRHGELLVEACDRLVPFMIRDGINACKASGHLILMMPLHKGADLFMSDEQFERFYWPSLRKVIVGLSDAGIVPLLFAEGSYNRRLEVIQDTPAGSSIWWFENTDMGKAKKSVGQGNCIAGNVPLDLLCTAKPEAVSDYCRKLIDVAGDGGGFILSSGAGIQGSQPDNIRAMIGTALDHGVY